MKLSKRIRKVLNYNPNLETKYKMGTGVCVRTGNDLPTRSKVCIGLRQDYRILKRYFKGDDIILPFKLRAIAGLV